MSSRGKTSDRVQDLLGLHRGFVRVDLGFDDTVNIDLRNSGVLVVQTDPVGSSTSEIERCAVAGVHRQLGASAAVNGIHVVGPRADVGNAAAGFFRAVNSRCCR